MESESENQSHNTAPSVPPELYEETAIVPYSLNSIVEISDACPEPSFLQQVSKVVDFQKRRRVFSGVWVLSVASSIHVIVGLLIMKETGLSGSVSPVVMSFFKYSVMIFTSISTSRATIFHPSRRVKRHYFWLALVVLAMHFLTPFSEFYRWLVYFYFDCYWIFFKNDKKSMTELDKLYVFWSGQGMLFSYGDELNFSPDLVLAISILTSAIWSSIPDHAFTSFLPVFVVSSSWMDTSIRKLMPVAVGQVTNILLTWRENQRMIELIKFALGLGGSILFQSFFRLKTMDDMAAFLSLAFAWVYNIILISASRDFGVLDFLLGNMVAGGYLNQVGLGIRTWIGFSVCVFLYYVRLHRLTSSITAWNHHIANEEYFEKFDWSFTRLRASYSICCTVIRCSTPAR